ncbi:PREDICTED: probable cyclic nucleotide-gated ion channel 20, chloroplastic [Nelumbo nucifera]|uniref:Probable cyclic nucleotide-gated ion channel 20, chloroplastic n=1 Tax=Nelumbo nucifera TaxID=4432 RepID=A0A1U8Q236_NELNU|nr:PREDICTED: probable cyclic nucleotide-gated ion channel 20, chloroplastic [Nelumbo nucifera]
MASDEKDEVPMLSNTDSQSLDESLDVEFPRFSSRNRSASMSITMNSVHLNEGENNFVGYTGPLRNERRTPFVQMSGPLYISRKPENFNRPMHGSIDDKISILTAEHYPSFNGRDKKEWMDESYARKNEHLLRSGPLGVCNDPYCTTCPTYNFSGFQQKNSKFHNAFYDDAKSQTRRICTLLQSYIPGVMNPHTKIVQQWNQFFVISCLVAIFVDPLFFFLLSAKEEYKCIVLNWPMTKTLVALRSLTDFVYFLHMLLQFRLAYVAPESRVVGAGELVDDPKTIALHYLVGYFLLDIVVVLPLPQILILLVFPKYVGSANYAKNLLRASILLQYIPRLFRCLPLLAGQSSNGFIFESAWANFVINLLVFMLAGHVVGSCWYLLGLQRVNQCLRDACDSYGMGNSSRVGYCRDFIDCGHGDPKMEPLLEWNDWKNHTDANNCFSKDAPFNYGIYIQAVNITGKSSIITRYIYSLFWGFQQISTLAGNQVPSDFEWEVLFTMAIIGLGLLLFALLIGNIQNYLQALGRRGLEMQLRRRDVEKWMSHRRLPLPLRRQVRQSEHFNWAATQGVNEEMLLDNLPEDLQRDICRHLFKFLNKVRIFALMEDPILDAIRERLRQRIYIEGSHILTVGRPVEKMVFIVRGQMESIGEDQSVVPLSEGDVCGEELLIWCLENSSVSKGTILILDLHFPFS